MHISVGGSFAEIRSAKKLNILYAVISPQRDYSVQLWSDKEYSINLRSLLNEQEWMQFKGDVLQIYADQNAKREALRKLINFNCYRSINSMYMIQIAQFFSFISRGCHRNSLRDPTLVQQFLSCPLFCIFLPLLYVLLFLIFACMLLDLLTSPRFFLFHHRHMAFLESVMEAHPELDPAMVEEELVQRLQTLLESLSRHHPGVHCKLSASVVHHKRNGSTASFDEDVFEIQFLKFAPETEL